MAVVDTNHLLLAPERYPELAAALGDRPETVIVLHHLRRGSCRAYVAGEPAAFAGAIIQHEDAPTEPTGFGDDPLLLDQLLQAMQGWDCICVSTSCAAGLGAALTRRLGVAVRYLDDISYQLDQPAPLLPHPAVRRLTPAHLSLLQAAAPELPTGGFGSIAALLHDGIVAAALADGQIVALASTSARSERHADIAVGTLPAWRNRGLASAAAAVVAQAIQSAGQTPVWSAGAHNAASLRIAAKLGFSEVTRRRYVILERAAP